MCLTQRLRKSNYSTERYSLDQHCNYISKASHQDSRPSLQVYFSVEQNLLNGHAAFIYVFFFFAMNCTKQHEEI